MDGIPIVCGASCARPPLALAGHANKQLIELGGGAGRQQCPPEDRSSELSWGWGLPWRPEGDDLSVGRVGPFDRLTRAWPPHEAGKGWPHPGRPTPQG